jgi:hypothetical protein
MLVLLLAVALPGGAAAETITTRLVEASNSDPAKVDPQLRDVMPSLKPMFNSATLKAVRRHPWQEGTISVGGGYKLTLAKIDGRRGTIAIGGRTVTTTLRPNAPLALGPLPRSDKKKHFVFITLLDE